jgi:hypothetical protein
MTLCLPPIGWRALPAAGQAGTLAAGLWCLQQSGLGGAGFQAVFLQLLFGLLALLPVGALFYQFDHLRTAHLRQHLAMAALGVLSLALLFAALPLLGAPLALGLAVGAAALANLIAARRHLMALAVLAGLTLTLAGSLLRAGAAAESAALVLPLAAGLLRTAADRYGERHLAGEPRGTRLFYGLLLPLPVAALPALISWQAAPASAWPWLVCAGFAFAAGHLLGRLASSSPVSGPESGPDSRRDPGSSTLASPPPGPAALLWSLVFLFILTAGPAPLDRLTLTGLTTILVFSASAACLRPRTAPSPVA